MQSGSALPLPIDQCMDLFSVVLRRHVLYAFGTIIFTTLFCWPSTWLRHRPSVSKVQQCRWRKNEVFAVSPPRL